MARKLTKLRIREISSVDHGANPGARVVLTKRDDTAANVKKPRGPKPKPMTMYEHQEAARNGSWEGKMSKTYRKMLKVYARASHPPAPPPPLDTDALARRISKGLARGETFEVASTKALRKGMATAGGAPEYFAGVQPQRLDYTAVTEADDPFSKMMAKAWEIADATGETPEQAFERIYTDPRNREIVQQYKRDHFLRATKAAGPGLRNDQQKRLLDQQTVTKEIKKLQSLGLSFESAATQLIRGKAA